MKKEKNNEKTQKIWMEKGNQGPYRSLGGSLPASHHGCPGSTAGQVRSCVGFVVDKVDLGPLFWKCFGIPSLSFHIPIHFH
jgi:hypothetical protein